MLIPIIVKSESYIIGIGNIGVATIERGVNLIRRVCGWVCVPWFHPKMRHARVLLVLLNKE